MPLLLDAYATYPQVCQTLQRADQENRKTNEQDPEAWKLAVWTRAAERVPTSQIVDNGLEDKVGADKVADQEEPVLSQRVIEGSSLSEEPVEDPLKNGQVVRVYRRAVLKRLPEKRGTVQRSEGSGESHRSRH